ncbi:putative uncharacterized protein DDB_G0282133 [Microplitis mediator]|uniref:putative uncharacterized protein DDB_G0282133 n=1 Tax=Microplitis mediator TaxID=375433 RepID=UPI0025524B72|nr:putative uncharacterized protein DDB_G0282133 [Microplitis mediator]
MFHPELYSLITKKSELYLASSLYDGLEDNNINQVKALLKDKEADPNVLIPSYGISPFHLVIGNESEAFAEEVTKLFLRHGGDPNVKSTDGMTPVHVAAAWGRVRVLELLLANGGDPLSTDDDGHTPFHYAFEGSYFEAIIVLAKYSSKTQDDNYDDDNNDDSNSDNEKPKVQITLEKIFINRGNVVAEYVPSEIDLTSNTFDESKQNIKRLNDLYKSDSSFSCNLPADNFSMQKKYSNTTDENYFNLFPNNNITLRRRQRAYDDNNNNSNGTNRNAISPILHDEIVSELKSGFIRDEKKLVKKIIRRLSDSFEKTCGSLNNKKWSDEIKNCKHTKKYVSLLPQPKIFKNNLECMKKKTYEALLDTSIVSKSPNFHINVNVNKNNIINRSKSLEKENSSNETSLTQPSDNNLCVKSASSTPRRKFKRKQYKSKGKEYFNSNIIDKNSSNSTYSDDCDTSSSSQNNESKSDIDDGSLLKDVARNLNDSYDDDYDKEYSELMSNDNLIRSKADKFNVDGKKILGINKIKSSSSSKGSHLLLPPGRLKNKVRDKIADEKNNEETKSDVSFNEKIKSILDSPGSSTPTSNYLSIKSELSKEEELELLYEINNIYQGNKTPPASISKRSDESWSSEEPTTLSDHFMDSLLIYKPSIDTTNECDDFYPNKKNNDSISKIKVEDKMESSDTGTYETPYRSFSSSSCDDSFVTVEEQYHYIDPEKKKAFLERRLCVLPKLDVSDKCRSGSSWLDEMPENNDNYPSKVVYKPMQGKKILTNCDLRNRLILLGEQPGPITSTTYHVYLKRLTKLEKDVDLNARMQKLSLQHERTLSPLIETALPDPWACNLQPFQDLEDRVFKEFETPKPNRRYRGGISKSYFNYILLDPRITNNLPRNGRNLSAGQRWNIFLKAIFYIGKGKATRPAAHLYDAFDYWFKNKSGEPSSKIRKILDIWRDSRGVICLHVYMNRMQEEAFTREAAMIDAIGLDKLTNCVRGNYYGIITTMGNLDKVGVGNYLLYKAMEIFMYEGERQLFPQSIT